MDTTPNQQATPTANNKPDVVIRDGRLKATVWRNDGENGPYWTTAFAKTITGKDGNPRDVQSFSQTETLRLGELGREAYAAINQLKRGMAQQQSQGQTRDGFKQSRRQPNAQDIQGKSQGY